MEKWLTENWYFVALIIISEILPFLPTKANGVAQAILNILTRLRKRKIV